MVLQPNIRFAAKDYWMFIDHITPVDDRALEEVFLGEGFVLRKKILRFLPYTTQGLIPVNKYLIRIYLMMPFAWRILGKQSYLVFEKAN